LGINLREEKMKIKIGLTVNGERHQNEVDPQTTLVEFLRESLRLTGTKEGCGTGDCGACTVLVDGNPVNSCLMLAADADGRQVTTIEGLAEEGVLHPLQQTFIDHGAVQCGFCTPAMILSAKALLDRNRDPVEDDIRKALSGVLCRCGSYKKIIESVLALAGNEKEDV
jgi:carbon-monoxide dehydrogenase small subunit